MTSSAVLVANLTFYEAFAGKDFDAMATLWAQASPVSCVHPGWAPLLGREAVLHSWRAILAEPESPEVRCVDPSVFTLGDGVAYVLCAEVIEGVVLAATNVFVLEGGEWRITHHQAGEVAAPMGEPEVFH